MEIVVDSLVEDFKEVIIATPKNYKKYDEDQIVHFISIIQVEGLIVANAAEQCGIPRSSAYKLLNEFNDGFFSVLHGAVKKKLKREPKNYFANARPF
ncbi:hypothetical protein BCV72DRAFT_217888 [Rhizopus microsporus var. microsporus]|uniref:Uncharacterized protein n=1 Tax=Rhizopus microsporus var. microsporus TaxID=86635 RepID=A0A1X0QN00_RHIZD|nr:hypothetical protein BCV72DRAFT_217888 [Rhizopus microsporus var. microsporus]